MEVLRRIGVVLMVFFSVTSCSAASDQPAVEETSWILEALGTDAPAVESFGTTMPNITLDDGTVTGMLAVNRVNGSYELSGDDISFSRLATTKMAGPPEAMEQEQRFLAALEAAAVVQVRDATLVMTDADGTIVASFTETVEG